MVECDAHLEEDILILKKKYEDELGREERYFKTVGYVKLFLVLLFAVLLFMARGDGFPEFYTFLLITVFVIQVFFWVFHGKIRERVNYSRGMIELYERHLGRINGEWLGFSDIGEEFIDVGHDYACDLDIVGKGSLFQYLNTTNTWHGRRAFGDDLLFPRYGLEQLLKRQGAVEELSMDLEFSNHIQVHLSKIGVDESTPGLMDCLNDKKPFLKSEKLRWVITGLPILTLFSLLGNVFFQERVLQLASVFFVGIQVLVWIVGLLITGNYLKVMGSLPYKLGVYSKAVELLLEKEFKSEGLKEIQGRLKGAASSIRELGKIASKISVKHNPLLYLGANILLLWDYRCAFALQRWKVKDAKRAEAGFLAIGEFESLLCFSHLPNICVGVVLPTFREGNIIVARGIGHPLLLNEKRVCNDLDFNHNIVIVSGSNMSGKTTFLRTIGLNIVLARTGSFVCARSLELSRFDVITSMRIGDDLSEGISTFYGELMRIKKIVDSVKSGEGKLFLIDEIFRGTNSTDRLLGAKVVIKRLEGEGATGLISTHDLELCKLEESYERIENYHFSEYYIELDEGDVEEGEVGEDSEGDKGGEVSDDNSSRSEGRKDYPVLHFDYKLKKGKSTTSNAKYLMKMVGILERFRVE